MNKVVEVEIDLPEGFEYVRYGIPIPGNWYLTGTGGNARCAKRLITGNRFIVKPTESNG